MRACARACVCVYNFCTNTGKRHGRSSGMRHGWRPSWSGVRTPVRLSVQGPVGEAPATAPFSIPLHHRYRRCVGWRVSSIFFLPPTPAPGPLAHTKMRHQARHTYNSAPRHCYRRPPGGACPPRIPLPLACGRGLELGSSGQQPAAQPLHHAAQTPARLRSLHPSCLPCPECFSVCVAGWWHPAHDKSRRWRRWYTSSSEGGFCGLLRGAGLNAGDGEVPCPELQLLILYQQTERRLGQLCCS